MSKLKDLINTAKKANPEGSTLRQAISQARQGESVNVVPREINPVMEIPRFEPVTRSSATSGKRAAETSADRVRQRLQQETYSPLDRANDIVQGGLRQWASGIGTGIGNVMDRTTSRYSGDAARDVSARTLSLMESFYKTGMPSDTVLATVNSLISYSADERFSCLDLAAVNLDDGNADIVKIGSPAGFLLSQDELKILEGDSLPMGALDAVHPATLRVTMHENDFLLFMSDGITAAFGSSADLCAYLSELRPLNPQALAENVLAAALGRSPKGEAGDDMTVLAVKLMAAA